MTPSPETVINDLVYVERYHREHGAPMTADIMARARCLIRKLSVTLGLLEAQGDPCMVVSCSDVQALTDEIARLQSLVDTQKKLLSQYAHSVA